MNEPRYALRGDTLRTTVDDCPVDTIAIGVTHVTPALVEKLRTNILARKEADKVIEPNSIVFRALPTKLDNIRLVRDTLGVGLREAKNFVDFLELVLK